MAATKKMIEYAKAISETLKIEEPDYEDYNDTSSYISDYSGEYKARIAEIIARQETQTIEQLTSKKISDDYIALSQQLGGVAGVYIFYDEKGDCLYIGKSINLQQRISQSLKERICQADISDVLVIQTSTVADAHILEIYLISELNPKLNMESKSPDKSRLFKIDIGEFEKLKKLRAKIFEEK